MENQQTQRLLFDWECNGCEHKTTCKWADTSQSCRNITDKLRSELGKRRRNREIIAKIAVTTEYIYTIQGVTKTVAKDGTFVLKEPYRFGGCFLRAEIQGKDNGGTFRTQYFGWDKT